MSILTYTGAERHRGIAGYIKSWLAESRSGERPQAGLDEFNDHLLRDIGIQPSQSRGHCRHLMRF